ncbi:MAG: NUDIX domain-containing protein [Candidatus Omnitrophota bacterium]
MNEEFSAGAVIFRKETAAVLFLMIYSARNKRWGFPKGHIEPNETEQQAALREIKEETGLHDLKIIDGFREEDIYEAISNRGEFKGQKIEKHSVFFLMETYQEKIVVDKEEIGDHKWLEYEDALAVLDFDSAKLILKKANEIL